MISIQFGRMCSAVALVAVMAWSGPAFGSQPASSSTSVDCSLPSDVAGTFCTYYETCGTVRFFWVGCNWFPNCEGAYEWCENRCGGEPHTFYCSWWGDFTNGECNCSYCPG
jgi:hypothetical protein